MIMRHYAGINQVTYVKSFSVNFIIISIFGDMVYDLLDNRAVNNTRPYADCIIWR
jgi:hypothetical protein